MEFGDLQTPEWREKKRKHLEFKTAVEGTDFKLEQGRGGLSPGILIGRCCLRNLKSEVHQLLEKKKKKLDCLV